MSTPTRGEWERQPRDPDPETDLGYEALPLQVFRAEAGDVGRLFFLPADPEFLEREAFIIADSGSVRPLDTCL